MAIDRRSLFALGGAGVLSAGTGAHGPEFDLMLGAITIKIAKRYGEWSVLAPDWDLTWRLGCQPPPVKWVKLSDFLAELDAMDGGA